MRMFLLCAALLFPSLAFSQNITRQGYNGGTPSLSGCVNATDSNTLPVGQCVQTGPTSSLRINDCWGNGVITTTFFNGSTSCDAAFASALDVTYTSVTSGNSSQSYCNVGVNNNPVDYNTYSCSGNTPVPDWNQTIKIRAYLKTEQTTNCSGTPILTIDVPVGKCTYLNPTANPKLYVIANCANSLVTSVLYLTPDCSVVYNSTGYVNSTFPQIPFGPFAQVGAASAANKPVGSIGSSCGFNTFGNTYLDYTCSSPPTNAPATNAPTNPPTTPAPQSNTTSPPPKNGVAGAAPVIAAIAAIVIAAAALQA